MLLQVVCTGPLTCVYHTLLCTKKVFFCDGGVMVHVSGGWGFVWGFREGRGDLSSHSLGEKAVEQSGGAGSDAPEPCS